MYVIGLIATILLTLLEAVSTMQPYHSRKYRRRFWSKRKNKPSNRA